MSESDYNEVVVMSCDDIVSNPLAEENDIYRASDSLLLLCFKFTRVV